MTTPKNPWGIEMVTCYFCSAIFPKYADMIDHMRICHPEDYEQMVYDAQDMRVEMWRNEMRHED